MTQLKQYSKNELSSFEVLVNKDIKSQITSSELEILVLNIDKWLYCLHSIKRDVEYNLSSRGAGRKILIRQLKDTNAPKEDMNKLLSTESLWKVNTLKFLNSLEKKILYVKLISKELSKESKDFSKELNT
jgi:hypothetical protein